MDGRRLPRRLLEEQAVSVIPGDAFGPSAAHYMRLGLAQEESRTEARLPTPARVLRQPRGRSAYCDSA
jgi:arginine:pyruvate transaminase